MACSRGHLEKTQVLVCLFRKHPPEDGFDPSILPQLTPPPFWFFCVSLSPSTHWCFPPIPKIRLGGNPGGTPFSPAKSFPLFPSLPFSVTVWEGAPLQLFNFSPPCSLPEPNPSLWPSFVLMVPGGLRGGSSKPHAQRLIPSPPPTSPFGFPAPLNFSPPPLCFL